MRIENEIVTVDKPVKLENGTVINRFSHVLAGAEIGKDCMIGEHCYIGAKAKIGNNVRIQNTNNIWDGVELGDNVFIAPAVVFTNHNDPSDRFICEKSFVPDKTIVRASATICANTLIVAPCEIGVRAMIGGASVVLRDIKNYERVKGFIRNVSGTKND